MIDKAEIMDESGIIRAITRISHEIIEKNKGVDDVVLIGIQRRGVPIAKMIAQKIREVEGKTVDTETGEIVAQQGNGNKVVDLRRKEA